jgi:hypothetical protein
MSFSRRRRDAADGIRFNGRGAARPASHQACGRWREQAQVQEPAVVLEHLRNMARRPPGPTARPMFPNAATGSAKNMPPNRLIAGRMSSVRTLDLRIGLLNSAFEPLRARARSRARSIMRARSTPSALPDVRRCGSWLVGRSVVASSRPDSACCVFTVLFAFRPPV